MSEWVEVKPDVNEPSTWYFESSRTFLSPEGLVQDNEYYFLLFGKKIKSKSQIDIFFKKIIH